MQPVVNDWAGAHVQEDGLQFGIKKGAKGADEKGDEEVLLNLLRRMTPEQRASFVSQVESLYPELFGQ